VGTWERATVASVAPTWTCGAPPPSEPRRLTRPETDHLLRWLCGDGYPETLAEELVTLQTVQLHVARPGESLTPTLAPPAFPLATSAFVIEAHTADGRVFRAQAGAPSALVLREVRDDR
jgi:hypothetical protein